MISVLCRLHLYKFVILEKTCENEETMTVLVIEV